MKIIAYLSSRSIMGKIASYNVMNALLDYKRRMDFLNTKDFAYNPTFVASPFKIKHS